MSNILPVNLEEHPASGRGRYSTVGVLAPVIRIERSSDPDSDGSNSSTDASNPTITTAGSVYRIVVTFVLEVSIVGFDQEFFDAISLRYLYCRGDQISLRPLSDAAIHGLQVTRERDKTSTVDAGLSPTGAAVTATTMVPALPTVSVQVQRDFKLSYQRSMNSWRLGLSNGVAPSPVDEQFSPQPQPLASRLAAFLIPANQQLLPPTRDNRDRLPQQDLQQSVFRVQPPQHNTSNCVCCQPGHHSVHLPRNYDRAAHWSWQTEASLRLWTPEIYSVFRTPVTVMREEPVAEIDALPWGNEGLLPHLYFDFAVDVQLRVLGVGLGPWLANLLKSGNRPAEMRVQSDTGQSLPGDHVRFSIACSCPGETISWPLYPTRNLQEEAEGGVALGKPDQHGLCGRPCRPSSEAHSSGRETFVADIIWTSITLESVIESVFEVVCQTTTEITNEVNPCKTFVDTNGRS